MSTARFRLLTFLSLASIASMGGCPPRGKHAIPDVDGRTVAAAQQRWPDATMAQLQHGHDVLQTRCEKCHSVPGPDYKKAEKWEPVVNRMAKKAKLDEASKNDLLRFLIASREAKAK